MMDALTSRRQSPVGLPLALIVAAAVLAAAAVGSGVAWRGEIALLPLAAIAGELLLTSPRFRLAFLIVGGLATLQSSQDLNVMKVAYLLGVGPALVAATLNLRSLPQPAHDLLRPLLRMSLVWFTVVLLSSLVAAANGTPIVTWLRDAAPYFLVAAAPVFAADAASSASRRFVLLLFAAAGTVAAVSFTVEWLDRRDLAELGLDRIALPSGELAVALFCYAASHSILGAAGRLRWAAVAGGVLSLFLATASRGALVILAAPPAVVLAGKGSGVSRWLRLGVIGWGIALLTLAGLLVASRVMDLDSDRALSRITSIGHVLQDPTTDPSFNDRVEQTRAAWYAFRDAPLLGQGPGHIFIWVSPHQGLQAGFTIDSTVSFPAKFGLVGAVMLLAGGVVLVSFIRRLRDYPQAVVARAALVGFLVTWVAHAPLSLPFEDKGSSFGLLFLLTIALISVRRPGDA